MKSILLIEDDFDLSKQINSELEKWGFKINTINDFKNILEEFLNFQSELIIMDINLPYYDGFYWCNKIRQVSKVPIIFLSSRDSNMDLIMGINNGGDDYITKPFDMEILITKMNAVLRRTYDYTEVNTLIHCGSVILDVEKGILKYNDNLLELTKNELKIISVLMKNKGKIISRENIMMSLWNEDEFVSDNTLTVNINRLRSRLKEIGLDDFIITKKGIGYMVK